MKRTLFLVSLILLVTGLFTGNAVAQTCVSPPEGLVSCWPGDGNADDIAGTHPGTLQGAAGYVSPGMVGDAFSFAGIFTDLTCLH